MGVLGSFNYTHSEPAVIVGVLTALGVAAALIWTGRPWPAAAIGSATWSAIAYVVGLAGQGDMAGLMAMLYAMLAALPGAIVAGAGAWIRSRQSRGGVGLGRREVQRPASEVD